MKRFAILLTTTAMALCLFGCTSNDSAGSAESSSSEAESSSSESTAAETPVNNAADSLDMHSISAPVDEPPIPCTKKAEIQNVSIMVPEDWTAEVGIGGYLNIASGDNISGSLSVEESDMNANNSDEEIMVFVNETMEQAEGFTIEEGLKVERKGNLAYVIVPFSATQPSQTGEGTQDFWGYSMCGYDDELIIADMSCTTDDKDVLGTFRWILENIEVS